LKLSFGTEKSVHSKPGASTIRGVDFRVRNWGNLKSKLQQLQKEKRGKGPQ